MSAKNHLGKEEELVSRKVDGLDDTARFISWKILGSDMQKADEEKEAISCSFYGCLESVFS